MRSLISNLACVTAVFAALFVTHVIAQDELKIKQVDETLVNDVDADPDFNTQGEYTGELGDAKYGAQVIARGDGRFDAVLLVGGLPGDGWDGSERISLSGDTKDKVTTMTGGKWVAKIQNNTLSVKGEVSGDLKPVRRKSPSLGAKPPEEATVLFDGDDVDAWENGKLLDQNLLGVGTRTKKKFRDFSLHLEFRTPFMSKANGQGRGNSGLYLLDQYECQILDSFGLTGENNECGGFYT
ncbi:MAG: putative large multi-functional protein, partial [Planctomycetaceae bacterium]|nr:putative large multi-functional protein [Planctomycetaceae bacterium]